jgi:hypothetical protein
LFVSERVHHEVDANKGAYATKEVPVCKHLDRISVALSAAIVLGTAALTPEPAQAFSNNSPAQRTIVVYKPVPILVYRGAPAASKSGGTNAGVSSSASSAGGNVGDVFKQALGDFAKTAIDGLLKLPSK